MNVVVVDRRGAEMLEHSGKLVVRAGGERRATVPLRLVDRLVVAASGALSTELLRRLAEAGAGVLVLPPRPGGEPLHLIAAKGDAALRRAQHLAAADAAAALALARGFVSAKIAGQAALLAEAEGGDARRLAEAAARLAQAAAATAKARDKAALLGLEGAAAAAFFSALATLFPAALGFSARLRRPPPDPVNVALSLGYTLAHHEALLALAASGLDPACGFLHEPLSGRDSLACDLTEPLRPAVERFAIALFSRDGLRAEHFSAAGGACLLGKAGRKLFYERAAEALLPGLAAEAGAQAAALAARLRSANA